MTSKINIVIPACLISMLVSLAFVNVAYADDPIWRESNNLYNEQVTSQYYPDLYNPYRLMIINQNSSLEGGQTYSLSFEKDSSVPSNTILAIVIDGQRVTTNYSGQTTFTFEVPQDYGYVQVYLGSNDEIPASAISRIMLNEGDPLPYEPYYSGFRFDFSAIAASIGQYVQPVLTTILPYIFLMIALIIGINAGIRVFRKTAT